MYINRQINDLDNFLKRVRMMRLSDTDDEKQRELDYIHVTNMLFIKEEKRYRYSTICWEGIFK